MDSYGEIWGREIGKRMDEIFRIVMNSKIRGVINNNPIPPNIVNNVKKD